MTEEQRRVRHLVTKAFDSLQTYLQEEMRLCQQEVANATLGDLHREAQGRYRAYQSALTEVQRMRGLLLRRLTKELN